MAKLTLKYGERVLREIALESGPVTIGRLLDNTVVIDNQAVSGHHARVSAAGGEFVVEDLESTNGTFVNEQPVTRHTLREGDIVLVGKHQLVFELVAAAEHGAGSRGRAPVQDLGGTVFLETKAQKELMDRLAAEARRKREPEGVPAPARGGWSRAPATLTVLSGATDRFSYPLDADSTLIGSSPAAAVRLRGWFKPKEAAAIARSADGYVLTPLSGRTRINSRRASGPTDLHNGDIIQVSRVKLHFTRSS